MAMNAAESVLPALLRSVLLGIFVCLGGWRGVAPRAARAAEPPRQLVPWTDPKSLSDRLFGQPCENEK